MPQEVARAQFVLRLCDRFKCLPSQVMSEDGVEMMRLMRFERMLNEVRGG